TLGSVSWYTTSEGGPHHSVNLYIYDLDAEGNPTGTLLYSERAVRNIDDQWIEYELPASVEAPRGCFVSINYPGFHAIGLDDNLREYPMPERAYAFSVDFASGDFMYFNNEDLGGNLMIRAYGRAYSAEGLANRGDSAPEFVKYNVWRSVGYGSDEWTAINNAPVAFTSLSDATWNNLPAGVYRYAVSAVYPDNVETAKVATPYIPHLMYGTVKMNVKTNSHSGSAAGAAVTLATSDLTESHAATVGADGQVEFNGVWRSQYTLDVELPGYEFDSQDVDMLASEITDLGDVVLKEIIAQPVNVVVSGSADEGYLLTWNESGEIFDGFEDHTPFAQASAGEVGWLYRDGDGARTFAESDFDFPGRTQPGSFMVFNPWLTTPSMAELRSASLPHTGKAELACFAGFTGSDDWFISPRLTYHEDFTFRFYARGYSQTYGEVIRVGYSTTGLEPEAFEWLADNIDVPKQEWTEYEYTVPADARYVAVNCISPDGFTLFIDDVEIFSGNGLPMNTAVSGPEVKYEVWLDGSKVADTDKCSYAFDNIPEDVHVAQVKAVYASGESEPATVQFGTSGIGIVDNDGLSIYPNPATDYVNVKGAFNRALVYDLSGVLMKSFDGRDSRLDLTNISSGYYILVVESANGQRLTFKLTVKK
ncbi:MAG: choice-of-anchor J domain-containing protein, partial [Muribaculaceae bacterium]|nr:choice-of-anchor J domain-containing protein [Muribaculaceae bacterium]